MRILITGGNGYVGRALTKRLADEHQVCVADNLRYGHVRFTESELSRIELREVDIRDADQVQRVIDAFQPQAIIHLAAIHFIPECESDPALAVSTNTLGTTNIASHCPPVCRLVFASSGAVYAPELEPHREATSPTVPSDVYGWSKLHGEQLVQYFAAKRRYPACIIRLFNVIGPGETNPHVVPEILAQLKAGRTILKLGNLDAKRDYVHVDDVSRGFALAATAGSLPTGEALIANLGTQTSYSVSELLARLRRISGIDIQVAPDPTRMRPSDRPFLAANNSRMFSQFGWKPSMDIQKTLEDLWLNPDLPSGWVERYR